MYSIKNDGEILLYDEIMQGWTAQRLMDKLSNMDGAITLRINSNGGDVFEAIALYNLLKPRGVTVYVDGVCASAASIIAMAGDRVIMGRGSMMMIHDPVSFAYGGIEDFKDMAELLTKIRDSIANIYCAKTGQEQAAVLDWMKNETWFNAGEAVKNGFADAVSEEDNPPSAKNTSTYEDGIRNERERLRELDSLMSAGREEIIARAKYETFESAQDIAVALLRNEARKNDAVIVPNASGHEDISAEKVAGIINRMRGRA